MDMENMEIAQDCRGCKSWCQSLQTKVVFLWLISLCSEACFAASNMPERHQETFFLRIPCHVSLEVQKTRLGQFFCREPHNAPTYLLTTVPKLSTPCEPIVCYCNVRKCNVVQCCNVSNVYCIMVCNVMVCNAMIWHGMVCMYKRYRSRKHVVEDDVVYSVQYPPVT